jgi:hypothetical protein
MYILLRWEVGLYFISGKLVETVIASENVAFLLLSSWLIILHCINSL